MPDIYDKIDISFSWNGDFSIGKDGDLNTTSTDQIQALVQNIQAAVASTPQDWEEFINLGAGLDEFIGEANTKETATRIESRVRENIITANLVRASDLDVKVVPVGIYSVLIIIRVQALATINNSLKDSNLIISLVFDYQERGIFVLDTNASI